VTDSGRSWVVEQTEDGLRLDVAVAGRLAEPRARTQQRLAAGEVTVDGAPAGKSRRVAAGERVAVRDREPAPPAPAPPPVPVRYEDAHLLVVAKPADLVVHEGAGVSGGTLVDALRAMGVPLAAAGGPDRPGVVHRLDRGTSGLLAVAKSDEAWHGLVGLLSRREVARRYWALVDGVPDPPVATIDAPIGRDPARRTRFRADPAGKPAVTHYDLEEAFVDAARLSVRLETGRTHQIRVHLAAVGHPVAGDALYGASTARARRLGLERPALHAAHLGFTHPVTGTPVAVDEPLPGDLQAALEALRREGEG
jgi:23S rRNA pseudouridine1911/1915/1917 synthase